MSSVILGGFLGISDIDCPRSLCSWTSEQEVAPFPLHRCLLRGREPSLQIPRISPCWRCLWSSLLPLVLDNGVTPCVPHPVLDSLRCFQHFCTCLKIIPFLVPHPRTESLWGRSSPKSSPGPLQGQFWLRPKGNVCVLVSHPSKLKNSSERSRILTRAVCCEQLYFHSRFGPEV